jgi:hypothetical protein
MPIDRPTAVDALHLDAVLSLDADRGVAVIDLAPVSFGDAYALTGLACFIASADRDGLPVQLVLPEHPDVRSWLSRMHLGDLIDSFEVRVLGDLPRSPSATVVTPSSSCSVSTTRMAATAWPRSSAG